MSWCSCSALLAGLAAADDQARARLVLVTGAAFWLAPRRHRVPAAGGLAFTTAMRMVDRVHCHTAYRGALSLPAIAAGLAEGNVGLLSVTDLADGRATPDIDHPHLPGWHPKRGVLAFTGDQLDAGTSGSAQLGATARPQLHGVHGRANRNVAEGKVIPGLDVRALASFHPAALTQPSRCDDVALLTVGEVQQRDPRRTVRVVLNMRNLGRDS